MVNKFRPSVTRWQSVGKNNENVEYWGRHEVRRLEL